MRAYVLCVSMYECGCGWEGRVGGRGQGGKMHKGGPRLMECRMDRPTCRCLSPLEQKWQQQLPLPGTSLEHVAGRGSQARGSTGSLLLAD